MEIILFLLLALGFGVGFLYWRMVWFFRNPPRHPPLGDGILSPADGTVVYAHRVEPNAEVVVIKQGVKATITDIVREDEATAKLIVGIFMSPFNVHYNRAPLSGHIDLIRHYPARGGNLYMAQMHLRILLRWLPLYAGSLHIVQNERTVTRIIGNYRGTPLAGYVVQIGSRGVHGIESFLEEGEAVERGAVFGMIRIGSQVDLVIPWREGMKLLVQPGQKVRAGESIIIE
ncbi:phosphatidylserine decarboxylase [Gammaproteobacteria bacterium]